MELLSGEATMSISFSAASLNGSALKGKDLLLQEQILCFNSRLYFESVFCQGKRAGSKKSCL